MKIWINLCKSLEIKYQPIIVGFGDDNFFDDNSEVNRKLNRKNNKQYFNHVNDARQ